MAAPQDLAAIILAAGYSSRMVDFKPLLPLGGSTVIEIVIALFRDAGIDDITVVVGHRADELKPVLDRLSVARVFNEKYTEGMFSSVVAGVRSLRSGVKGCLLLPVDMPLVGGGTVRAVAEKFGRRRDCIVYPVHTKRRGHPPLIPAALFPEIVSWKGEGGLRALLKLHEDRAVEVEVPDEGILLDLDTPEDYARAKGMDDIL